MTVLEIELPTREQFKAVIRDLLKGKAGWLMYVSILGIVLLVYALLMIIIFGHGKTVNANSLVPWGLQITTYVYLVLISTGCTFVNFFGYTFYEREYKPISARTILLAFLTAICGMIGLATELGHVERLYLWATSPQPKSPMWWMSVFYSLYVTLIVLEFINVKRNKHSKVVMWLAFLSAIVTHSTLGSLFGVVEPRFYFYSSLMPIYFLIFAFLTGAALAGIVSAALVISEKIAEGKILLAMRKFIKIGLGLAFLFTFWRLMVGIYGQAEGSQVFELTLLGQVVWGLILACVIPFLMLTFLQGPKGLIYSGVFIMLIQLKTRLDLIVGGFKIPVFRAYQIPKIIHYTPSVVEIFIFVGAASLALFLYLFAEKLGFLDLKEEVK